MLGSKSTGARLSRARHANTAPTSEELFLLTTLVRFLGRVERAKSFGNRHRSITSLRWI